MEECDELSQLEELLCADLNEDCDENSKTVQEIDIFSKIDGEESKSQVDSAPPKTSVVHNGDTDSSDDEERRNYTERKYNDYGSEIKKALDSSEHEQKDRLVDFETRLRQANIDAKVERNRSFLKKPDTAPEQKKNTFCVPDTKSKQATDVYTDPVFGLRITKPLISSTALLDRMQGREAVNMLRVKRYVENEDLKKDWVIAGAIVKKSAAKKSQKGNQFLIWTLSDLRDDMKTVSMFLFRKAYNELWKTMEGTVVAVLNPNVLDRSQNSQDQACLSVENPDRVMILGQSKDLGICKSKKKNGAPCTAFVNLSKCEHCIYHVKQEYQKFSKRQELQSSTMGKGLVNLQNKVFGKSTVIYGGKAYSALPSGNQKKVKEMDQNRLMSLSDYNKSERDNLMINKAPPGAGPFKKSEILHSPTTQRTSDSERLNRLTGLNSSPQSSKKSASPSLADKVASSPKLGKGFSLKGSGDIDLSISYGQKIAAKAKENAIKLVQQSGGIKKIDPNNIKGTESGKKRALENLNNSGSEENESKKLKPNENIKRTKGVMSERFKKILEATSAHQNLIEQHDDDEQDKYFNKLEKKEAMEEKMLNTFKLACKAVRCVKCKYTAFSAAQLCKDERHPLKVLDTFKRFFKCADCNNRTVALEVIPLHSCSNCSSSRWVKAPMLREKKLESLSEGLSIRGEEETFIGGQINKGKNINLLVPDG
ncbi:protein MCM10 homolog [Plodia interpunctella]|uniref:protein MCM10 homolog n=1 Tax=Plodia interpunctella TaxID=58824 RepID=UPI002367B8AC|nr:protein MCM10 homolog [Plodia interpunctella]